MLRGLGWTGGRQRFDGEAKAARFLSSGRAYVQDERYAAGAGMRGSGQAHPVALILDIHVS